MKEPSSPQPISRNVIALGLVSFFNDVASELVYPLIPIFLTSVLGAPASVVGLIEGLAESTASLLKVVFGRLSDRWQKRKPFAVWGYSLSTLSKLVLGLASSWGFVLAARVLDRIGKGVRTSPRDALIAESSTAETRGRAFGLHRALDTLGAVVGPLLALLAINVAQADYTRIFLLAFIPALIGVLLLAWAVRETPKAPRPPSKLRHSWDELPLAFKLFLFVSLVFALGNSSDAFLILRAQNLGFSVTQTILVYILFNITYALLSFPSGALADRLGPRRILIAGFAFFAAIYLLFGFAQANLLWVLFPLYGIYMAMTEGVGKAYIANLVPTEVAGTAFGIYQTALGISTLLSSLLAGFLWDAVSSRAPFFLGSALALLAALLFAILGRGTPQSGQHSSA